MSFDDKKEEIHKCLLDALIATYADMAEEDCVKVSTHTNDLFNHLEIGFQISLNGTYAINDKSYFIRSHVCISFSKSDYLKTVSRVFEEEYSDFDEDAISFGQEMANVVLGMAKGRLSDIGDSFELTVPVCTINGNSFKDANLESASLTKLKSKSFEFQIETGFDFKEITTTDKSKNNKIEKASLDSVLQNIDSGNLSDEVLSSVKNLLLESQIIKETAEKEKKYIKEEKRKIEESFSHSEAAMKKATEELKHAEEATKNAEEAVENANKEAQGARLEKDEARNSTLLAEKASEEANSKTQKAQSSLKQAKIIIESASNTMRLVEKEANHIKESISLISDISRKSKNLALNATIESSRAGVAGRSFAVVAKEMKELSFEVSNTSKEISKKIDTMSSEVDNCTSEIIKLKNSDELKAA